MAAETSRHLASKAVTTPIAMAVAQEVGGIPSAPQS
ncbi:LrgB family protein [Paraburkholderia sp. A1RO-5L]